jgi:ABC-type transport system involved in multi-copper enzyme maturation permease subunit
MMTNAMALAGVVVREMYRRKDFYVLLILTVIITLAMGSVNFFNDDKIVRYLKELCLLLIWISSLVMAISVAARQLPMERENRTIFPLLAKPISRGEVILGKFLGCWFACGLALLVFYLFFSVLTGVREHSLPVLSYLQAIWLHWMMLGIVTAMVILGSLVFAAPSSNATISFVVSAGILLLGRHLNKVALQLDEPSSTILYTIYYNIPHFEIFDVRDLIVHNQPPIEWGWWALATPYAAVYIALFLVAAWWLFKRKSLSA